MTASKEEGRKNAVNQILTWAGERDPFWTLPQVVDNYRRGLHDLSDDELRTHWKRAKSIHEQAGR